MERLIEFIGNHPILVFSLVVVAGLLAWNLLGHALHGFKMLAPAKLVALVNHDKVVLLDIRSEAAYASGHILHSTHAPMSALATMEADPDAGRRVIIGNERGEMLRAAKVLAAQGHADVACLEGGILAWKEAGLPLVKRS